MDLEKEVECVMFKVNDYVVYGLMGVCQITHIKQDEYNSGNETEYYVLEPVYQNSNNMTIMVPVDSPNTVMRAISTKDDVLSLIAMMPQIETMWVDDERRRTNIYKAALKTGKTEEWIKVLKTLYLEKEAKAVLGKTLTRTDEDIFTTAETHLNQEFAIALDISPEEVGPYILGHIQ